MIAALVHFLDIPNQIKPVDARIIQSGREKAKRMPGFEIRQERWKVVARRRACRRHRKGGASTAFALERVNKHREKMTK
jgi:hypothetical protein